MLYNDKMHVAVATQFSKIKINIVKRLFCFFFERWFLHVIWLVLNDQYIHIYIYIYIYIHTYIHINIRGVVNKFPV